MTTNRLQLFSIIYLGVVICYSNAQLSLDDLINNVFTTGRPSSSISTSTVPVATIENTTTNSLINNPFLDANSPTTLNRSGRFKDNASDLSPNINNNPTGMYRSCGLEKECVPRHLCIDGAISTTGESFIDIRIDGDVCAYNELCCDLPNKRSKPVIPAVPPKQHDGCGWRNVDGVGYKITGKVDESEFGEFPWMTAILRIEQNGEEEILLYECGGSLIAPNVILTAAHCVSRRKPFQLMVRAGEWDTQTINEILPHDDKKISNIIIHEQYNKGTLYNDVALLITEEPFELAENIKPICLPSPEINFDHERCVATGWGKDKFGRDGKYQVILKKIDLPVVPHSDCQHYLRQTRLGYYYELHPSALCAGGEAGHDVCKGDGGSPLVCPIAGFKDRYYQAGIVAWGISCAEENVPGVYANIPYLRSWISEKLHQLGIDFTHFTP